MKTSEEIVAKAKKNECRGEPVFHGGAKQHDWRLFARLALWTEFSKEEGRGGNLRYKTHIRGYEETWYCTQCRLIEVREVPV